MENIKIISVYGVAGIDNLFAYIKANNKYKDLKIYETKKGKSYIMVNRRRFTIDMTKYYYKKLDK